MKGTLPCLINRDKELIFREKHGVNFKEETGRRQRPNDLENNGS